MRKQFKPLYPYGFGYKTSSNFTSFGCVTEYEGSRYECRFTLANRKVEFAKFYFQDKKLAQIGMHFNANDFEAVRDGLISKFGQPYVISETPLRRQLTGVGSSSYIFEWVNANGDDLFISSHEKDGSSYLPKGMLFLVASGHREALEADQKRHGKKSEGPDL